MAVIDDNILNSYVNSNNDITGQRNLDTFFGFNQNIYVDPAINGYAFVFATKPSLFLYPLKPANTTDYEKNLAYENMCKDPELSIFLENENLNSKDSSIIRQLSYFDFPSRNSLFIPLITNSIKGFNPSDTTLDTQEAYLTKEGYRYPMPTFSSISEGTGTFTVSVNETSNLDFTKMMTIWVKYINKISNGTLNANPEMIKQNMLDYTSSFYYFVLAPDGRTLKYWARYVSCFPTNIPYSGLSYNRGVSELAPVDVTFAYTFKEDMNPRILEDFNMISLQLVNSSLFTNSDYFSFIEETQMDATNGYYSYATDNKLLSKTSLYTGRYADLVNDPDRDPLIMFESASENSSLTGNTQAKYILSFGETTIKNSYANNLVENTSAFSYRDLVDKL